MLTPKDLEKYHQAAERILNAMDNSPVPISWHEMDRIPMSKAMLFRTESVKDNPEGRSILRNAYRSWYFKRRIQEIEAIGIERDLAGLPVIHAPERLRWSLSCVQRLLYQSLV